MCSGHEQSDTNRGPSNQGAIGDAFISLEITATAPSTLEFVEAARRESLDTLGPCAWDCFHSFGHGGTLDDSPSVLSFETGDFIFHGFPKFFSIWASQGLLEGWEIRILGRFSFHSEGTLTKSWWKVFLETSFRIIAHDDPMHGTSRRGS